MRAENAILTKSRALYAKRLTRQNYNEMLQCRTVRDVASYLKSKTDYGKYFGNLNTSSIHRGWLEANLKNVLYQEIEALSHYDYTMGDSFYEYFITVGEIFQITRSISLINEGNKEKYLLTLPTFFGERAVINLVALGESGSPQEVLAVLEGTPYYDVCKIFINKDTKDVDMMSLSKALDEYKFKKLYDLCNSGASGANKKALIECVDTMVDIYNINIVYRLNKLKYNGLEMFSAVAILPYGSLKMKDLEIFFAAKNEQDFIDKFKKTKYGKYLKKEKYEYIELATNELLFNKSIHDLRFSVYPRVVMLSYLHLFENEIDNIFHIVEGIRYGLTSDEIGKLLVGVDN